MATRHLVGLDIGSKFVKALQLSETSGSYKVTEFGIAEITQQMSPADAVSELLSRKRFKTKRVVTAVSGRFVFVRYINMPNMTEEEIKNAAKYELGKYIPVEVDEVIHDSQKLEELAPVEGQEPEMRVLLVAGKSTFIEEHVAILQAAGLQPAILDVDAFALGNAYELSGLVNPQAVSAGKLVSLVDIGASKTTVNIMTDTMSYFTREFYKGGDDLTESISKQLSMEVREAEMLKRDVAKGSTSVPIVVVSREEAEALRQDAGVPAETKRVQASVGGIVEDICHDINISIDYFENQFDKKVDEVLLTGGGSNCVGLVEQLEQTVQKPVRKWNPIQFIELELPQDSMQEIQDNSIQVAIALGLASRIRKD